MINYTGHLAYCYPYMLTDDVSVQILGHIINWVACFLIELLKFFIYSGNKTFIKYMI